jgi:hypothetical protein
LAVTLLLLLPIVAQANAGFDLWKEQFAAKLRRQGFSEATVT